MSKLTALWFAKALHLFGKINLFFCNYVSDLILEAWLF